MKNACDVTLKIPEDVLRKLLVVCDAEGRSLNNQFLFLARNSIAYYERVKGTIDKSRTAAVDLPAVVAED